MGCGSISYESVVEVSLNRLEHRRRRDTFSILVRVGEDGDVG